MGKVCTSESCRNNGGLSPAQKPKLWSQWLGSQERRRKLQGSWETWGGKGRQPGLAGNSSLGLLGHSFFFLPCFLGKMWLQFQWALMQAKFFLPLLLRDESGKVCSAGKAGQESRLLQPLLCFQAKMTLLKICSLKALASEGVGNFHASCQWVAVSLKGQN